MRKYAAHLFLVLFATFFWMLSESIQKVAPKSKTFLKRESEKYFLELDQKFQKLDLLGQKNYLGQLTRQGSKWPIRVQFSDSNWKILEPQKKLGLDNNHLAQKIQMISTPSWIKETSHLTQIPAYYRVIPLYDGTMRILEVQDFEAIFLKPSKNLQFSFLKSKEDKSSFPFFSSFDTPKEEKGHFTIWGYATSLEKNFFGLDEPLVVRAIVPYNKELKILFFFTIFFFLVFHISLLTTHSAFYGRTGWLCYGTLLASTAVISTWHLSWQHNLQIEEKNQQHYDSIALEGVTKYLCHIEQLARSLIEIHKDNIGKVDDSFFKNWPFIEKIQLIDHDKNLLHEACSPHASPTPSLKTLFLKNTGWILKNPENQNSQLIHYRTEDAISIYLEIDLKPIFAPLLILRDISQTAYHLEIAPKNLERFVTTIAQTPFYLKMDHPPLKRWSSPLFLFLLTLGGALFFPFRIFYVSIKQDLLSINQPKNLTRFPYL
ncbi:MAG: hypothetical protein FJZ61_02660 [Chlamydiae bacterium]|nr:hypothetical protein [Chlamydiota bacterium]